MRVRAKVEPGCFLPTIARHIGFIDSGKDNETTEIRFVTPAGKEWHPVSSYVEDGIMFVDLERVQYEGTKAERVLDVTGLPSDAPNYDRESGPAAFIELEGRVSDETVASVRKAWASASRDLECGAKKEELHGALVEIAALALPELNVYARKAFDRCIGVIRTRLRNI